MKKKSFIVITILLVAIILGLCAYIAYDKGLFDNKKESKSTEKKAKDTEKLKVEELSVDSEQVVTLIDRLLKNTNNLNVSGTKYFGYYFQKESLNSENIDNDIVLYTALKKVLDDKNITSFYSENISVSSNEIVPVIKKIFGNFEHEDKTIKITPCDPGTFIYDNNTGNYTIESHGCGGTGTSLIEHKITNAVKKENTIEITLSIVYVNCYSDGMTDHCKFGNSIDENQKIKENDILLETNKNYNDISELFDFTAYMNELNKYKFTFTKDSNDNYIFAKVEKI